MSVIISHTGTIISMEKSTITVKLDVQAACGQCTVAGVCGAAKVENKIISVNAGAGSFQSGEKVKVTMASRLGYWAVFYTYLLPVALLLSCLFTVTALGFQELWAALCSIAVLFPYYFILYLLRSKMAKVFYFSAEPLVP